MTAPVTHTIDGIVFALLFALLVSPMIPLPNSTLGNLGKGMINATALAILSAAWWVPYVAFPGSRRLPLRPPSR
jgi:hypothetical protein